MAKNKKSAYVISAVAKIYKVHPQTLRIYEREGLLKPSRTQGNARLYTDEDLKQLEVILRLTRELGINLAGVEAILNMRKKMDEMERQINELIEYIQTRLRDDDEIELKFKHALVKVPPQKIVKIDRGK